MTQKRVKEAMKIMIQMDLRLQEYAIDMLRHLKAAQRIITDEQEIMNNKSSCIRINA